MYETLHTFLPIFKNFLHVVIVFLQCHSALLCFYTTEKCLIQQRTNMDQYRPMQRTLQTYNTTATTVTKFYCSVVPQNAEEHKSKKQGHKFVCWYLPC